MRKEKKEQIWWFKKSALEVMETSFLLCFANPARIHNPKMCFFCCCCFFSISFTPWFSHPIQRSAVLSNPLFSLSFAPFHKPILVVLNILPALHRNSLRRKLLSDKSVGRMFMRGGVAKFLNKTCVTEAPSKEAPRCVVAESEH